MKKIFYSMMLLGACLFATPAQAQLRFGVEGGLNLTKARFSEDALKSDNRAGFFIGPKVQFKVPIIGIGVDGALLYSQKKVNAKVETMGVNYDESKTLSTFAIPINLRYEYGFSSLASVYFATGPEFDWNMGGKKWGEYTLKSSTLSWNIGVGATLLDHLQAGISYNFGIGKTGECETLLGTVKKVNLKDNTFRVKVAYLF